MSKQIVTTPIGKTKWFSLQKEDKFGNYTADLILEDSPETHKLISKIDELDKTGNGRKPYKQVDGKYVLKLKLKSKGQKKDGTTYVINPPVIYDRQNNPITGEALAGLSVGNDSEIRAKVELDSYEFMGQSGVSAKVKSVQITKLVEFAGGADLGFDALEFEDNDNEVESDDYDF